MTELIPLDVIILDNGLSPSDVEYINRRVSPKTEKTGFQVSFKKYDELWLHTDRFKTIAAPDSLFYVHGNLTQRYVNFDGAISRSTERPDLRWIIAFDPLSERNNFNLGENYSLFREMPEITEVNHEDRRDFVVKTKMIKHFGTVLELFDYNSENKVLCDYLSLLHQQRSA
ncbi:MAG: hypothetical protein WCV90_08025 [Candidatus Woesearchaeota archaeon]|jgi:hypothetical protein